MQIKAVMWTGWQTWALCCMRSFSTFGVAAVVTWHSKLLNLLFEGFLHTQWQDCRCETSPHPKGWLLSDNWNAECAGEGACRPATTDRLRQYVIVWYSTLLYKKETPCVWWTLLFFWSSHHISEARNIYLCWQLPHIISPSTYLLLQSLCCTFLHWLS